MKKRFLISFDTKKTPYIQTDILIIGSGVAGLRAAIEAAKLDLLGFVEIPKDKYNLSTIKLEQKEKLT